MNKKSDGFTLVELMIVIAILGIIAAIAIPRIAGFKSMAEESVCAANRTTVERMYSFFLVEKNIEHEDSIFDQFLIESTKVVCPAGDVISYEDGKVKCSKHTEEENTESDDDGSVPFL